MRLDSKFRSSFLYPLLFGFFVSFTITIILVLNFSQNYKNKYLLDHLDYMDAKKIEPLILSVNNMLFQKFQKSIYSLFFIKKYYDFYRLAFVNNFEGLKKNQNLFINARKLSDKTNKLSNIRPELDDITNLKNYSFWFIDKNNDNLSSLINSQDNMEILRELNSLLYTMPIIRSVYETARGNNNDVNYDLIYFASNKTNLLFGYPINYDKVYDTKIEYFPSNAFFKAFDYYRLSDSCKRPDLKKHDYFIFQCRDWWIQLENEYLNDNSGNQDEQITITTPYKYSDDKKFGITTCLKFNINFDQDTAQKFNQISAFCIDIDISDLQFKFDEFNQQTSGYFYVIKLDSNFPIYYPFLNESIYFSNLERLEFDMFNKYYVSELSEFSTNTINFLKQKFKFPNYQNLKSSNNLANFKNGNKESMKLIGNFKKNQKNFTYTITPVFFYNNFYNSTEKNHLLSIVYVFEDSVILENLQSFVTSLFPRFFLQMVIFGLIALILLQISWHLIMTIGFNIVRPIKNLKFQIKGMNAENTDFDKKLFDRRKNLISNSMKQNKHMDEKDVHEKKEKLISLKAHSGKFKNFEYKQISNNISDDSFSDELDEDDLGIISSDMNEIFGMIIDLKNVTTFSLDKNNKYDSYALIKYLNSINTLGKFNKEAEKISESNLGATLITHKKFNNSLYHLKKSLIENKMETLGAFNLNCIDYQNNFELNYPLITNQKRKNGKFSLETQYKDIKGGKLRQFFQKIKKDKHETRIKKNYRVEENLTSKQILENIVFYYKKHDNNPISQEKTQIRSTSQRNKKREKILVKKSLISKVSEQKILNKNNDWNFNNPNRYKSNLSSKTIDLLNNNLLALETLKSQANNDNYVINVKKTEDDQNRCKNIKNEEKNFFNLDKLKHSKDLQHQIIKEHKLFIKNENLENIISTHSKYSNNEDRTNNDIENNYNTNQDERDSSIITDLTPLYNIKSRYPKLIYSFKEYFKGLRELIKNKTIDKMKFCKDILMYYKYFNLSHFENIILLYLYESILQNNIKRQAEAILEYIDFIISYKIKTIKFFEKFDYNTLDCSNYFDMNFFLFLFNLDNFNVDAGNLHEDKRFEKRFIDEIKQNNKNLLIGYMEKLKFFFSVLEKYSTFFTSEFNSDYYKSFIEIITEKRIDDLDLTEMPNTVIIMKFYFLKGRLAKVCGHYQKSLEFFYKSRESFIISDGEIIVETNKKIKKIYCYLIKKIEEEKILLENSVALNNYDYFTKHYFNEDKNLVDNNENQNTSTITLNLNDFNSYNVESLYKNKKFDNNDNLISKSNNLRGKNILEQINFQKEIHDKYIKEMLQKVMLLDSDINSYNDYFKDLLVLIDLSAINENDIKKYENLLKLSIGFYDNYICIGDRFGVFLFHDDLIPILKFEKKNISDLSITKNCLNHSIKNIHCLSVFNNNQKKMSNNSQICKNLLLAYQFLNKKWNYENEKWIIVFCFHFFIDSMEFMQRIEKEENIKKYINLIIIGIDFDAYAVNKAKEFLKLFGEKSHYINDDDVTSLKNIFKKKVLMKDNFFFPFEMYKSKNNEINNYNI